MKVITTQTAKMAINNQPGWLTRHNKPNHTSIRKLLGPFRPFRTSDGNARVISSDMT